MKLPTLYKKTSTGADQMWEISTVLNVIITRFGQVGGKIQEARDEIKSGKNIGKANETTPTEQAELEARAQWEKKKTSKGYVESLDDARKGKVDALVEGGIFPMLAKKFDEEGHKIVYPAFVQPKLDGHRCIATVQSGKCTLWSRTRKPILSMPHIIKAVEGLKLSSGTVLDGELYNHSYRNKFEELTALIRPDEPRPGHEVVHYHIYDVAKPVPFTERKDVLATIAEEAEHPLRVVDTILVKDEDELMLAFEDFLKEGYEGAMVRNASGIYVNKRSSDLQKVKEFIDEEFEVIGVEEGRGKMAGHGIFVCKTKSGAEFRAKMQGELETLKSFFNNPKKCIGKMLTVKFQGYTTKNGVPRFPVAMRFREDV